MFLGHFALGMAARSRVPGVPLAGWFVSVQFADLLWPTLLLFGVETVRIDPGATAVTPLDFAHYPVSHSLLALVGWGVAAALVVRWRGRIGWWLVGAGVVSHWLLDLIVHRPDLPVWPGGPMLGLSGWNSPVLTACLEFGALAIGAALFLRAVPLAPRRRMAFLSLVAFLALVQLGSMLGPPPPSVTAVAVVGHAQWLMVLWAWFVDRDGAVAAPGTAA